ncbi:hypothetical protein [Leclercia sp. AS011]|uniref:hypothetical protein n=1 Tax=Leclercia sp. AS011 TaxID=3081257 RepID=UPI00301942BF
MAYGAQVLTADGKGWIDVIQPTYVLDMHYGLSGSGSLAYSFDTNLFYLKVVVLNYTVERKQNPPTITVNNNVINYSLPSSCTFLVMMEAR